MTTKFPSWLLKSKGTQQLSTWLSSWVVLSTERLLPDHTSGSLSTIRRLSMGKLRNELRAKRIRKIREAIQDEENAKFFNQIATETRNRRFQIKTYRGS